MSVKTRNDHSADSIRSTMIATLTAVALVFMLVIVAGCGSFGRAVRSSMQDFESDYGRSFSSATTLNAGSPITTLSCPGGHACSCTCGFSSSPRAPICVDRRPSTQSCQDTCNSRCSGTPEALEMAGDAVDVLDAFTR